MTTEISQNTIFTRFFHEVMKQEFPHITIGTVSHYQLPIASISYINNCAVFSNKTNENWEFKTLFIVYNNNYCFKVLYTEDEPEYPHLEAICERVNAWLDTYSVLMI